MKYALSTILLYLTISNQSVLLSQGYYIDRGQNGFGISGGYSSSKDASSIGGSLGYSASGAFDFGLSIFQISLEEKLLGKEVTATALSPFITLHVIKQNETTPMSVAISASYESDTFASDALDIYNLELTANGYSIGASLYGNIVTSPTMKVQPSIGLSYFSSESEVKDKAGNSMTDKEDGTVIGVGFALLFQTKQQTLFRISPSVSIHKNTTSVSISGGYIFIL